MCRLVVCEKPAPLAERFTQDGALGEGRMRQDQLHGQTQPKGADNELLFPSTGKRQQASWRAYHSGEVRETTLETPQIDEYTLPLDLVGLHEGRRKTSVFTILGDASSAAIAAEDEFRDSGLCPNRKPSSPDASLNLLQLMTATDCSSHVGRCASGGDLGRANCQWQTDTSVSCPVSVGAVLPFSSSLVMEATSGSGSSTSSGKQKQKTASESSSGSGGGGGASSSSSQPRSQRGGRRGGLGSESSDSDDNDDDERKRRPPRDLKKEPKSKVDFPDDDDEATDSADEGADPVIDCDPLSNSSRAGAVGTSSEVGEEEQRVSRDDGGGSVTSTVTIESKEVISLSSPRLASPVNMAVGYGVLDAMPPRVIDKDSPESTLAGTPILDSPRLLQDIPSASHTPLMSPEVVCVSQTSTSVPAITSAARNRTGLTIGAVQPSPSLAGPSFNLPFETTWGWQPPVYSPFPLTAGSHPGSIANTPAATDPGGFLRAGAPVFLQGTVCQESDGVLIISVRWRNRMFSGSLIDTGQHEWAPPRLSCGFSDQLVKVKDLCSQQEAENQPVNVDVEEVEPKENPSSESNEVEITGVDTKSDTTESATEQGPELEQLEETEMESMETEAEAPPTEPANSAIAKTKLPEAMETTSSKISSPSLRQSLTVPVQKTEQPDNTHFSDISDASDGETECLEDGERAVQPRPSASTLLPLQLTMGQPRSINGILPVLGGPRVEEKKSSSDQQKLQLVSPTPPLPDFAAINARSPAERREKEEGRHHVPQKPTSRKASGDGMEDILPDSKGPPQLHPPQVESSAAILRSTLLSYPITTSSQPSAVTTVSVPGQDHRHSFASMRGNSPVPMSSAKPGGINSADYSPLKTLVNVAAQMEPVASAKDGNKAPKVSTNFSIPTFNKNEIEGKGTVDGSKGDPDWPARPSSLTPDSKHYLGRRSPSPSAKYKLTDKQAASLPPFEASPVPTIVKGSAMATFSYGDPVTLANPPEEGNDSDSSGSGSILSTHRPRKGLKKKKKNAEPLRGLRDSSSKPHKEGTAALKQPETPALPPMPFTAFSLKIQPISPGVESSPSQQQMTSKENGPNLSSASKLLPPHHRLPPPPPPPSNPPQTNIPHPPTIRLPSPKHADTTTPPSSSSLSPKRPKVSSKVPMSPKQPTVGELMQRMGTGLGSDPTAMVHPHHGGMLLPSSSSSPLSQAATAMSILPQPIGKDGKPSGMLTSATSAFTAMDSSPRDHRTKEKDHEEDWEPRHHHHHQHVPYHHHPPSSTSIPMVLGMPPTTAVSAPMKPGFAHAMFPPPPIHPSGRPPSRGAVIQSTEGSVVELHKGLGSGMAMQNSVNMNGGGSGNRPRSRKRKQISDIQLEPSKRSPPVHDHNHELERERKREDAGIAPPPSSLTLNAGSKQHPNKVMDTFMVSGAGEESKDKGNTLPPGFEFDPHLPMSFQYQLIAFENQQKQAQLKRLQEDYHAQQRRDEMEREGKMKAMGSRQNHRGAPRKSKSFEGASSISTTLPPNHAHHMMVGVASRHHGGVVHSPPTPETKHRPPSTQSHMVPSHDSQRSMHPFTLVAPVKSEPQDSTRTTHKPSSSSSSSSSSRSSPLSLPQPLPHKPPRPEGTSRKQTHPSVRRPEPLQIKSEGEQPAHHHHHQLGPGWPLTMLSAGVGPSLMPFHSGHPHLSLPSHIHPSHLQPTSIFAVSMAPTTSPGTSAIPVAHTITSVHGGPGSTASWNPAIVSQKTQEKSFAKTEHHPLPTTVISKLPGGSGSNELLHPRHHGHGGNIGRRSPSPVIKQLSSRASTPDWQHKSGFSPVVVTAAVAGAHHSMHSHAHAPHSRASVQSERKRDSTTTTTATSSRHSHAPFSHGGDGVGKQFHGQQAHMHVGAQQSHAHHNSAGSTSSGSSTTHGLSSHSHGDGRRTEKSHRQDQPSPGVIAPVHQVIQQSSRSSPNPAATPAAQVKAPVFTMASIPQGILNPAMAEEWMKQMQALQQVVGVHPEVVAAAWQQQQQQQMLMAAQMGMQLDPAMMALAFQQQQQQQQQHQNVEALANLQAQAAHQAQVQAVQAAAAQQNMIHFMHPMAAHPAAFATAGGMYDPNALAAAAAAGFPSFTLSAAQKRDS